MRSNAAAGCGQNRVSGGRIPLAGLTRSGIKVGFALSDEAELQRRTERAPLDDRQGVQVGLGRRVGVRTADEGYEAGRRRRPHGDPACLGRRGEGRRRCNSRRMTLGIGEPELFE